MPEKLKELQTLQFAARSNSERKLQKTTDVVLKYENFSCLGQLIKTRIAQTKREITRVPEPFCHELLDLELESLSPWRISSKHKSRSVIKKMPKNNSKKKSLSVITFDTTVADDFRETPMTKSRVQSCSEDDVDISDPFFLHSLPKITFDMPVDDLRAELKIRASTTEHRVEKTKESLLKELNIGTICILKARMEVGSQIIDRLPRVSYEMTTAQLKDELLYRDPTKKQTVRGKKKEWFLVRLGIGSICIFPFSDKQVRSPQESLSNTVETVPTFFSNASSEKSPSLTSNAPEVDKDKGTDIVSRRLIERNGASTDVQEEQRGKERYNSDSSPLAKQISIATNHPCPSPNKKHSLLLSTVGVVANETTEYKIVRNGKIISKLACSMEIGSGNIEAAVETTRKDLVAISSMKNMNSIRSERCWRNNMSAKMKYFNAAKSARRNVNLQNIQQKEVNPGTQTESEEIVPPPTAFKKVDATILADKGTTKWMSKIREARKAARKSLDSPRDKKGLNFQELQ